MRGISVFIILLLLLGVFAVLSESRVIAESDNNTPLNVSISSAQAGGLPETAASPLVDRSDDVTELLPCSDQPGDCTLRSALIHAGQRAEPTTIHFAEHMVINLERPLPTLDQAGLKVIAPKGQEVRINGNGLAGPVFHIAAPHVHLEGLRIYGAGAGNPNVLVNGPSREVVVARNLIGDDDAPEGNCGQSGLTGAGIYVQSDEAVAANSVRAWIYGNIIECHPGDGLVIMADGVQAGLNVQGQAGSEQKNIIRGNGGAAVRLDNFGGNTIQNNLIFNNGGGSFIMTNFTNNIMNNEIR